MPLACDSVRSAPIGAPFHSQQALRRPCSVLHGLQLSPHRQSPMDHPQGRDHNLAPIFESPLSTKSILPVPYIDPPWEQTSEYRRNLEYNLHKISFLNKQ